MWNSVFDSMGFLSEQDNATLDQIFEKLGLPKLTSLDYEFLAELIATMKPVAVTLDLLQAGDEKSALGYLIPRIYELNHQITMELPKKPLVYCKPLVASLSKQLQRRYGGLIDVDLEDKTVQNCVLATVSHPKFKLQWCQSDTTEDAVRQFVIRYVEQNEEQLLQSTPAPSASLVQEPEEEFGFIAKRQRTSAPDQRGLTQLQLMQYFADNRKDLSSLNSYPVVKKMFKRFNTCQTSSADVERLFSCAGVIQAGRRSRLSPEHLQDLLFLKSAMKNDKAK